MDTIKICGRDVSVFMIEPPCVKTNVKFTPNSDCCCQSPVNMEDSKKVYTLKDALDGKNPSKVCSACNGPVSTYACIIGFLVYFDFEKKIIAIVNSTVSDHLSQSPIMNSFRKLGWKTSIIAAESDD